jgi:hypothetical protein
VTAQEFGSFGSYSVTLRLSNPRLSIAGKTQPAPFPNRLDDDFVHTVSLSATIWPTLPQAHAHDFATQFLINIVVPAALR